MARPSGPQQPAERRLKATPPPPPPDAAGPRRSAEGPGPGRRQPPPMPAPRRKRPTDAAARQPAAPGEPVRPTPRSRPREDDLTLEQGARARNMPPTPPPRRARPSGEGEVAASVPPRATMKIRRRPAEEQPVEPTQQITPPPMEELGLSELVLGPEVDGVMTSLHGLLERELDSTDESRRRERAVLLYEAGHVEELVRRDPARALSRYGQAAQDDPSYLPALRALGRHHADDSRWREVLSALDSEIRASPGEERRAALLARKGELLAHRLSDTEAALEALEQACALAPHARRAVEILRGIYARLDRWEDLADTLRKLIATTVDPTARAQLMVELAELSEHRLGSPEAAEELYGRALAIDPRSEKAAVALRRLYQAHGSWKELADLLAADAGREHEPDEMFSDLYRAARIVEVHLADDARAASLLETAAALRPHDTLPLVPLVELYGRMGRYDEQASVLSRLLRLVRDPADRASICYRLGRVAEDWLGRTDQAIDAFQRALKEQPGHSASLRALAELYERLERWSELLDLELLRAERAGDELLRANGYLRAARLCEERLDDVRRAVDLYDRAWRMRPGLTEAFRALDRILIAQQRWDALAELYERKSKLTRDRALASSLLRSAARLHERELSDRDRAIRTLEALRATEAEAAQRAADAGSTRGAAADSAGDATDAEIETSERTLVSGVLGPFDRSDRDSLMTLCRLYEEAGRMEQLRRTLEEWAALTEDESERVDLRRRIGELLEGPLRKTEQAVDTYRALLEDAPRDRPTRERLKAIFERSGRWNDLLETIAGEIEASVPEGGDGDVKSDGESKADGQLVAELQLTIGRIAEDKLGDLERAQAAYEAAVEADSECTPALLNLEDLLRRQARWDRLVELLALQAERVREPARAAAAMCRAGETCEAQVNDSERAERYFSRALELDPGCGPARHGLERLYLSSDDRRALESHYLREAEGATNPVLRVRAYLRLGQLFDGPGDDTVGAVAAYESALKVVSDQPDALNALAAICRRTGNWQRLAELLARIAATTNDRAVAIAALKEWGSIVEIHLAQQWDPAPIFERVLEADPGDAFAMMTLLRLAYARRDAGSLLRLTMREIQVEDDPVTVVSSCLRAATLLLAAGKQPEAAEILRRGLADAPTYLPAVRTLRKIAENIENWREVADLLTREADLVATPDVASSARVKAGNILLDRFGEIDLAKQAFQRVFDADPENGAAFGRLAEILARGEAWAELVDTYRRRLEAAEPVGRVSLQLDLARLYRDRLRDASAAVATLEELLAIDGDNRDALADIADLCTQQGRWREAEGYLAALAAAENDADASATAKLRRAVLLEERLGDEDGALVMLQEVLERRPQDREALARCMAIYRRRGDWERAVGVLGELAQTGPAEQRVDGLVDLAEIYSRTLGDPEQARASLRKAAAICVETGEGIARISEYFERRGDFDGLVELLGDALESLPPEGSTGSVKVRLARARLLAGRLLRPSEAEIEIRKALQGNPQSLEARLELAGLHLWGDNLGEATTEYLRVLDHERFSTEAFRGLYRVHERRGDLDRAAAAAQAIVHVGEPEESERKLAEQAELAMAPALASAASTPLGVDAYWQLLGHRDEPAAARELLLAVSDYLPGIIGDEIELPGHGNMMPLGADEPLAQRCTLLSQVLGIDRVYVFLGQDWPEPATALPGVASKAGEPASPRLVIDQRFASKASRAVFRFAVGRALAQVLTRSLFVALMRPRRVEMLMAALVEPFERGFGDYLGDPTVEDLGRQITRALPRRVRRALEEPARNYAADQPVAAARWRTAARRSAERAGLLLSGDVAAAAGQVAREKVSDAVRADLLRFAVGPHLHEARRRLGLAI